MYALKAAWQILWSIPLAILWVMVFTILYIGWGLHRADKFITHWNNMVDDDSDDGGPLSAA